MTPALPALTTARSHAWMKGSSFSEVPSVTHLQVIRAQAMCSEMLIIEDWPFTNHCPEEIEMINCWS